MGQTLLVRRVVLRWMLVMLVWSAVVTVANTQVLAQESEPPQKSATADEAPPSDGGRLVPVDPVPIMPVPIEMEGCVEEEREVRRLVAIELQVDVIGHDEGATLQGGAVDGGGSAEVPAAKTAMSAPSLKVKVVCREAQYRIYVVEPDPERTRTRGLDLRAMGTHARPRFIALAIVEALITRPIEAPSVVEVVAEEPAPVEVAPEVIDGPAMTHAALRGVGRYLPVLGQVNWGAGLVLAHALSSSFGIELDLTGEGGTQIVSLGEIVVRAASIATGAFLFRRHADLAWRFGSGLRLGLVQITGVGADTTIRHHAFAGPWGGPYIAFASSIDLGERLLLEVGAEAGHALLRSTGRARVYGPSGDVDRVDAAGISGPWLALVASVGWRP